MRHLAINSSGHDLSSQNPHRSSSYEEKTCSCTDNAGKRLPKYRRATPRSSIKGPDLPPPTSLRPHLNPKPQNPQEFKKDTNSAAVNAKDIKYPLKQHAFKQHPLEQHAASTVSTKNLLEGLRSALKSKDAARRKQARHPATEKKEGKLRQSTGRRPQRPAKMRE